MKPSPTNKRTFALQIEKLIIGMYFDTLINLGDFVEGTDGSANLQLHFCNNDENYNNKFLWCSISPPSLHHHCLIVASKDVLKVRVVGF